MLNKIFYLLFAHIENSEDYKSWQLLSQRIICQLKSLATDCEI